MLAKFLNKNFLWFFSFLSAFLGLVFFFSYKAPIYSKFITQDASKEIVLLGLTSLALLLYIIYVFVNKKFNTFDNKQVKFLFIIFPITLLISALFSHEFTYAFLGKYTFLQSAITYIAITILVYIVAVFLKQVKRLAWFIFFLSNLFITIPSILALIISRLGLVNFSNKLVYFVDNWDTVALTSGIIILVSLIYNETIANSKSQKYISGAIAILHLILVACIILPDIWYAILLSTLAIFILTYKKGSKVYNKLSFYILIVSFVYSFMFLFSNGGFTTNLVSKYVVLANKYSGVNYTFVKPRIGLSMDLALTQIKQGRIFGAGPNEFYKVWQNEKSQAVINSNYWATNFTASYSALTTLLVTIGVVGSVIVIIAIVGIFLALKRKIKSIKQDESFHFDEENRFYLFTSLALFIFATLIFIFFANVPNAIILLAIAIAFAISNILKYKESNKYKTQTLIFLIALILTIIGTITIIKKAQSAKIINLGLLNYQSNNDINSLENDLLKAVKKTPNDFNYRLLTNFYLFKTQNTLTKATASSSQEEINNIQNNALNSINQALASANTAINIDKDDYNNYINIGSIYSFLMNNNNQNKEANYQLAKNAYSKAAELYPKNPAIYLTLAQLEFDHNQSATSTKDNLDKSLQIKPNYSEAYFIYSQLASGSNDRTNAIDYALKAIQSNPNNIDAYLQYGILVLNNSKLTNEDLNNAYVAFVSVLQLDPNNLMAGYYLGITYTLAGEYKKAEDIVTLLKQILPNDKNVIDLENLIKARESASKNIVSDDNTTATSSAKVKNN